MKLICVECKKQTEIGEDGYSVCCKGVVENAPIADWQGNCITCGKKMIGKDDDPAIKLYFSSGLCQECRTSEQTKDFQDLEKAWQDRMISLEKRVDYLEARFKKMIVRFKEGIEGV